LKRGFAIILLLVSLVTLSVFDVKPVTAQYQGNIIIEIDGSINPSTAPIQRTRYIYSLISDLVGSITVHMSNIILDGSGHSVPGISLQGTSNVTVKNFLVVSQGERFGVFLNDASNNLIIDNEVSGFWSIQALNGISFAGIYVRGGNSNTITQNNLMYNLFGMLFISTSYNLIVQNNITSNLPDWSPNTCGIYFFGSSNNTIYHNNFVNNTYQAQVSNSANAWDDVYLGNYWSNYNARYPNAIQVDDSGLYNIPYSIDEKNIDRYPLTQPFNSEFYAIKIPLKIFIMSPVHQGFNGSSIPLSFTVNKHVVWMSYSLDRQDNVTITGNATLSGLTNGLHNITVYAKDEFENTGASKTISFSVDLPESFPTLVVMAVGAASVSVVGVSLLVYVRKRKHAGFRVTVPSLRLKIALPPIEVNLYWFYTVTNAL
jgi:parallel beta-helix repeat protein